MRIGARFALLLAFTWLVIGTALAHLQQPTAPPARSEKPEGFSPIGFENLRAFEQAYPARPGSPEALSASAGKYWVYQGLAYRGSSRQSQGAVWTSLGPLTAIQFPGTNRAETISGRVAALAISPTCRRTGACRLWVGAAGGGVWRTDNAMSTDDAAGWRWIGQGLGTNNIGSLALDPNDPTGETIYVGTGETNTPQNSGAGTGVYRSMDGGDHWTRLSTVITDPAVSASPIDFTSTRGVSTVVVEPGKPQTIYVATTTAMLGMTAVRGGQDQITGYPQPRVGLYKTENGGVSWSLIWVPPLDPVLEPNPDQVVGASDTMIGVRLVKLDPQNPDIVYASAWNNAIHRSAPSLEGGDASFKPVFAVVGLEGFQDLAMFDLTVKDGHTRIYAYNGTHDSANQSLYRLDNADVPASALVSGSGANLTNTGAWIKLSSSSSSQPGWTSYRLCSSQCFYDLVVAVPEGQPDTVLLGGVALPTFGEGTIRSTDAGASFQAFSSDAQNPRNYSHVDVRAIVFHPQNPDIAFVGSDGGVVRNDGTFRNFASQCQALYNNAAQCPTMLSNIPTRLYYLNAGLQTLQFYNIALDPHAPLQRMLGGLQDNSTIWYDGTNGPNVWKALFPYGDGTSASGFHPTRPNILFASYQSTNFFTNFRDGDPARWVRTSDPIQVGNERATITASTGRQFISFDPVNPDTQFTGFQHVWRTKDNGGDQAFLEATCRFPGGTSARVCGDWVALGVAYPFASGTNRSSPSRQPGDLTSDFYGADRVGGLIVAAERTPADAGTLWAGTSFGRLFVSKNADAAGPAVTFTRIDTPVMPNRFVTRIVVDRTDPNVAFISYSGFNALTPSSPGHVFRATYHPGTRLATFDSLDHDLGDLPINTLAVDDARGDVYAGTDYGPLVLRKGSATWGAAGIGFPEALMVDLEFLPAQRLLVAATHGLGIFYFKLPTVGASDEVMR